MQIKRNSNIQTDHESVDPKQLQLFERDRRRAEEARREETDIQSYTGERALSSKRIVDKKTAESERMHR